jgi:hypothetical protein
VLPNSVVGRAFNELGVEKQTIMADGSAELAEVLPAMVELGLQKIYGFQHNDGGWGWWYDDSRPRRWRLVQTILDGPLALGSVTQSGCLPVPEGHGSIRPGISWAVCPDRGRRRALPKYAYRKSSYPLLQSTAEFDRVSTLDYPLQCVPNNHYTKHNAYN